jgi:MinD superfamily P-loop ATPase
MKIAIASGKGGTGKTTLATNLATYLSEKQQTLLVDLDVEEPNSALFLSGELLLEKVITTDAPQWDSDGCLHCGLCQEVCNFHAVLHIVDEVVVFPALCHSCYACSELCPQGKLPMKPQQAGVIREYKTQNLHFIEGRMEIGVEQATPVISQTMEYGDSKYSDEEYIKIYDAPPGTACPVVEVIREVDYLILVTEPTPFGLHDLKLAVDVVRKFNKPFGVVVNRHGVGNNEVEKWCSNENIEIMAKIPFKREIAELYSGGSLLYDKVPEVKTALDTIIQIIGGLEIQ